MPKRAAGRGHPARGGAAPRTHRRPLRAEKVSAMGKKSRAAPSAAAAPSGAPAHEGASELTASLLTIAILYACWLALPTQLYHSSAEGRAAFFWRFVAFVLLGTCLGRLGVQLLMSPARALARRMPGADVPTAASEMEEQENTQHDPQLVWPPPTALEALPAEWRAQSSKRTPQPYFLNHVRGSTRCRQAAQRLGGAIGTLAQIGLMAVSVDNQSPRVIGLELVPADVAWGAAVGAGIVTVLFVAELALGWLRIIGYGEVVVPRESLAINLLWDALFHIGVSVHEEASMRGWLLVNTAQALAAYLGADSVALSMSLSVALQASLFALLHVGSPGATRVGLLNLWVGGTCAALNVLLSGGLSFGLGWHFGWNLFMGHLLGLSTSGIPMAAKLVSVLPHPQKAHLHGGRFGPEQSPLAPLAYLLGVAALVALYGTDGVDSWRARLATGA